MDSNLRGVSRKAPSPAEVSPKVNLATSSGSASSSFPIRAPPTLDSEFDFSLSANLQTSDNSSSSGSYSNDVSNVFESEGFWSGEDDFETASERQLVAEPDDDFIGNGDSFENPVAFGPFVSDTYVDTNEESSSVEENGVSRAYVADFVTVTEGPLVAEPDDGLMEDGESVGNPVVFRSFVNDPCEDTSELSGSIEGNMVSRAYVAKPHDQLIKSGNHSEDPDVYKSSVNAPYGETDEKISCLDENGVSRAYVGNTHKEGKFGDLGEASDVDIGISVIRKPGIIPIAMLSRDSDEESLVLEEVEDDICGPLRQSDDTHILEPSDSGIRVKIFGDEELEDDRSEPDPELDDEFVKKLDSGENDVNDMELRESDLKDWSVSGNNEIMLGDFGPEMNGVVDTKNEEEEVLEGCEIVDVGPSNTCSIDITKCTISTEIMKESGDFVVGYDGGNHLSDDNMDSKVLKVNISEMVKGDNLGSNSDIEFNEEIKDREKGDLERSFSVVDSSKVSFIYDTGLSSSNSSIAESSKGILHIGQFKADTDEEIEPNILTNSPYFFTSSEIIGREIDELEENSSEQNKIMEKIRVMKMSFLSLVNRLGISLEDQIVSQVLHRLLLLEMGPSNNLFSQLELDSEDSKSNYDFPLNILVIGKTGVGKTATINSIFGEEKAFVDAFEPATSTLREIVGTIEGNRVRIFDTPGLRPCGKDQSFNRKVLLSVKKIMKRCPLDIVLYVDRLDTETRDLDNVPLLRSITDFLGSAIWRNAIITLTHAGSTPPDGPSGLPLSYDLYVAQRSRTIQHMISQSLGLCTLSPSLIAPISLVENHSSARKGENGEKLLPNGEKWRPRLLLLCASMKILSEANLVAKGRVLHDCPKGFGTKARSLPLACSLYSPLLPNAHLKRTKEYENRENETVSAGSVPLGDVVHPLSLDGVDGVSLVRKFAIWNHFPAKIGIRFLKDKRHFGLHLDSSISAKKWKTNEIVDGLSVNLLAVNESAGLTGDHVLVGKRFVFSGNTGTFMSQGETGLESNIGIRVMKNDFYDRRSDQSPVNLSMTVKISSSNRIQITLISTFSVACAVVRRYFWRFRDQSG